MTSIEVLAALVESSSALRAVATKLDSLLYANVAIPESVRDDVKLLPVRVEELAIEVERCLQHVKGLVSVD